VLLIGEGAAAVKQRGQRYDSHWTGRTWGDTRMQWSRADIVEKAFAELDRPAWDALKLEYDRKFEAQGDTWSPDTIFRLEKNYSKYFDLDAWFQYHARLAMAAGLHEAKEPCRILDLGCGAGIFLYIAKMLGHDGVGLDLATDMYRQMADVLGVTWRASPVLANTPLPDDLHGFDMISAIAIKFDRLDWGPQSAEPWTLAEWEFLLHDAASRLNPEGRLFIKPNYFIHPTETDPGIFFKDARILEFLTEIATVVTPAGEFTLPASSLR
jgi:SAM-dependent methyltransferase